MERDSAGPMVARWGARLRADSSDRAAAIGLATIARLTYDYPTAERLYRLLYSPDSARPDPYAVYARLGLAWALEDRGRSNDAGAEFSRARTAAQAARAPPAEGEALVGLSFVRARTEGMSVGLALLDTAKSLIPDTASDLHAERLRRRAIVLGIAASPEAMVDAAASIAVARRAGDLRAEAHGVRAAAKILYWRGQDDSSVVLLRHAEELFRRAHDRTWHGVTLTDRAQTLLALGFLGEAKEALQAALVEGEASRNGWTVAVAHTGFGAIAIHFKDLPTAKEHLTKAAMMYDSLGDPSSAAIPRKHLAVAALATGDMATARRQTLAALEFYRSTEETPEQFELQRTLAAIAMRERDWPAAHRSLGEARALAQRLKMSRWSAGLAYDEGRLALLRGDFTAARKSFVRHLAVLDTTQHMWRYDARLNLADIFARSGDLARAEREATSAGHELDRWRATLGDRELRLLAFQASPSEDQVSTVGPSDREASVARVLGALAAGGRAAAAFELAEDRRARELADGLLQGEALRAGTSPSTEVVIGRGPVRVTADGVAAQIPDHTALLEFVAGAEGAPTTLFVVQRAGVRARVLTPNDSLGRWVGRFATLMERGGEQESMERALGDALLGPSLELLDSSVTRLVVVPDGPLHQVPWDALRLADGRYAVERYAISIAPSAAVVMALWRRARETGTPARLLALGDPAFAGEAVARDSIAAQGAAAETYRSAFDATGGLPRLEGSAKEARLVARYTPDAEVRLRQRASAAYLKRAALAPFRIIHFATHALVDDRSVARTALALAPGEGESGFLGPGDLAALRLDADLVVLSACRSAGGVVVEGEGIQGLTAPLLQAGARSVVATRWRIGDQSTVHFIEGFYDALARGLPLSDALRAAKIDAIRRGAPPREWAAFTAVGDPLVTVSLRPPPRFSRWWLWAALAGLALALAVVAGRYGPRRSG